MNVIHTSSLGEIEPQTLNGGKIVDLLPQIRQLFQNDPSTSSLSDFFSEPIVRQSEVAWRTSLSGHCQLVADLSAGEQARCKEQLQLVKGKLDSLIAKINSRSGGGTLHAQVLDKMMETPDLRRALFRVGDNLVLAEWGCLKPGQEPPRKDIVAIYDGLFPNVPTASTLASSAGQNLSDDAVLQAEPSSPNPPPPLTREPSSPPLPPPPLERSVRPTGWSFWRWLILLLLLLLLIFGILRACSDMRSCDLVEQNEALDGKIDEKIEQCSNGGKTSKQRVKEAGGEEDCEYCIRLVWNNTADLDLKVIDPNGEIIDVRNKESVVTGGALDVDANSDSKTETPVEQIVWRKPPPSGDYQIVVWYYAVSVNSVQFKVEVREKGKLVQTFGDRFVSDKITCVPSQEPAYKGGPGVACENTRFQYRYRFNQ
ncbi:MAG: hypothetical protein FJ184_10165 [Gammaproteobacteria bacterium]|nr:hypothetical protein [Gammaproteobacteria bacterium]